MGSKIIFLLKFIKNQKYCLVRAQIRAVFQKLLLIIDLKKKIQTRIFEVYDQKSAVALLRKKIDT